MKSTLYVILLFIAALPAWAQLPKETADLVTELNDWELQEQVELKQRISEKRSEVIVVLQRQLESTTKSGNLEGALAIKGEIERLRAAIEPAKLVKQTQKVDRTDPKAVAEAFWKATLARQWEIAARFVHEDDRKWFLDGAPEGFGELQDLPKDPVIGVEINGGLGWTKIENWRGGDNGIEINRTDGIWWIEN